MSQVRLLPRQERRASIVAAAAGAFASGGFEGTSMEDIATAAGVTKLIVYRHFESKEELYLSIVSRVASSLHAAVSSALARGRRRGVIVTAFLDVARSDPDGFRLLWRHSFREPRFAHHAEEVHVAAVSFARARLGSSIRDPMMLEWAAPMIVSFLVEATLNWLDQGAAARDERYVEVATTSLEALVASWSS